MKFIPAGIANKVGRQLLTAKKNSPRAMFIIGIGGVVVSTVLACRATLKLDEVLDEMDDDIAAVKNQGIVALDMTPGSEVEVHVRRDLAKIYFKGSLDVIKLYGPSALLGAVSIGCLTASHVELSRRNASLTAAYAGLQTTFEAYRDRVKKEIGEEKERDIRHGVHTETVEIDGKKMKVKVFGPDGLSPYYRIFNEDSSEWQQEMEYNRAYILCQQNWLNDLLAARGHVFLNEVYDALGLKRSPDGQSVGWIKEGNPRGGDGYIDFGMYLAANKENLLHGENYFVLDFNVDGVIYDLI